MFSIILRKELCGQAMYIHFNVCDTQALSWHTDHNNTYIPRTKTTVDRRGLFAHINWICDALNYRVQFDSRFETEEEYYQALAEAQECHNDSCLDYIRSDDMHLLNTLVN